jgi:hypothetical protein
MNIIDRDGDGKVADDIGRGLSVLIAVVIVIVAIVALWGSYARPETDTTVVAGKERVCSSNGDGKVSCRYLVYTERGTYQVADSIIALRWNTSDLYGRIKPCHRYEVTAIGWRWGPMSLYPNVTGLVDLGRVEGCEPS